MIPPSVTLVRVGIGSWRLWAPIPVLLLWPLAALGLAAVALLELVASGRVRLASTVGAGLCQLQGLKVDLQTAEGERAFVWLI